MTTYTNNYGQEIGKIPAGITTFRDLMARVGDMMGEAEPDEEAVRAWYMATPSRRYEDITDGDLSALVDALNGAEAQG